MSDTATHTFQVGNTYPAGHGDHIWLFTVISRTAKFLTIEDSQGETRRVGVYTFNGREGAKPFGTYSMCPVLNADRVAVTA